MSKVPTTIILNHEEVWKFWPEIVEEIRNDPKDGVIDFLMAWFMIAMSPILFFAFVYPIALYDTWSSRRALRDNRLLYSNWAYKHYCRTYLKKKQYKFKNYRWTNESYVQFKDKNEALKCALIANGSWYAEEKASGKVSI